VGCDLRGSGGYWQGVGGAGAGGPIVLGVKNGMYKSAAVMGLVVTWAGSAIAQPGQELFPAREEPPAISPTKKQDSAVSPSIKISATALPEDFELPRSATLMEGSAVSRVSGTLVRVKDQYFFVPESGQRVEANGPAIPGMILMPNQRLEQMAAGLISRGDRAAGTLTGQVFNYRGRTHVMVMQFSFAVSEEVTKPEEMTPVETKPDTTNAKPQDAKDAAPAKDAAAKEDDVAAIVRDLQAATERPRALARPDQQLLNDLPKRRGEEAEAPVLVSERTVLVRKRGRLVRLASAEGRFAFAFDNDPDSPAPQPMLLQPCAMLQAIEDVAGEQGDGLTFELTGRVTRFGERNFVLPEFYQVIRPADERGAEMRSRQ